jgi:hypothetical protein
MVEQWVCPRCVGMGDSLWDGQGATTLALSGVWTDLE